jgi:hypothetical protein
MNRITQPEVHPDAESLNAFVEQALPAVERQQILAHLASCNRCREVLFLAQKAAGMEADASTVAARPEPIRPWRKWFAGWRWTWIPATALAGLVGFAALHHYRNLPSRLELARSTLQEPVPKDSIQKPAPLSKPAAQGAIDTTAPSLSSRDEKDLPVRAKKAPEYAKQPAPIRDKNELAEEMKSMETVPSSPAAASVAGPSSRGETKPVQKPFGIGGPLATNNVFQQQAPDQQELAQDQLHNTRYSAQSAGVGGANGALVSAGRADAQNKAAPSAGAPAPSREAMMQAAAKSSLATSTDDVALDKKKITVLPSGMSALSVATAQGRTVAIDLSGSMFLSEAPQGKWKPVATQWAGRAVLVRARQTQSQAEASSAQPVLFELVNDSNAIWVSSDGKTWGAKPLSPQ